MIAIPLVIALCLWGGACVSTKSVHYYALQGAAAPANQARPDGPTLLVGTIVAPEELQDSRIRYRAGSNQAGAYEYHRWTERPGSMVRTALIHALRESGKYQHVLEAESSAGGDYLLRGRLEEFEEVDRGAIQTKIALHVELVDRKSNQHVWDRGIDRTEPVDGKSVAGVVESFDRNLRHVAGDTADAIEAFLATRR